MNRKHSPLRGIMVVLVLTLFVFTLGFAGAAEAYIARSGGATAYGIARSSSSGPTQPTPSQPTPSQPTPQPPAPEPDPEPEPEPEPPAPEPEPQPPASSPSFFSSGSYGMARSGSGSFGSITRPSPSQPAQPAQPAPQPPAPQPDPQPVPQPPGGNISLNAQEQLLFNLVNNERVRRGLSPLQLDARLTYLARLKSRDMIDNNYFAHLSPTYGRAGDMIRSAGIPFTLAAENIGVGGNINTIFSAFMDSSGHRNKILGSRYTLTGIGIIYQPGRGYLVTQLFVAPR